MDFFTDTSEEDAIIHSSSVVCYIIFSLKKPQALVCKCVYWLKGVRYIVPHSDAAVYNTIPLCEPRNQHIYLYSKTDTVFQK
jgi:hypothetical protein